MKLASLKTGGRDGELVVVNHNLNTAIKVPTIATTMQQALDNWQECYPKLMEIYADLNAGKLDDAISFTTTDATAPLPRAYQWADGSAYLNHVELVRKARGATMPENFWSDPLMYQGGSDYFLGATEDILVEDTSWGVDFEAEIAVVTTDVPMGITPERAIEHIALVMLVNDVSLRNLIPNELKKGFGFFQSKPATSCSPVAVTLDELGTAWEDGKVKLPLISTYNNSWFGNPDAGADMAFSFPELIAHAAKTRFLGAGAIVGSGTISNKDRSRGSSCLAEKRMLEIIESGSAQTPFMQYGDTIKIEMLDADNQSIFGAIDQQISAYTNPAKL